MLRNRQLVGLALRPQSPARLLARPASSRLRTPISVRAASTESDQSKQMKSWAPIAAAAVGLGAVFFLLTGSPKKAAQTADQAGTLGEMSGRQAAGKPASAGLNAHRSD